MPEYRPVSRPPVIDPATVRAAIACLLQQVGLAETSARLGVAKATVARIVAGIEVREGSLLAAASRLGLVVAAPPMAISSTPSVQA